MKRAISRSASVVIALSLFASVGCSKKESPEASATSVQPNLAEPPKPAQKDVATLITGDKPTIPEIYKGLTPGMTVAEAKAKVSSFSAEESLKDPAYDGINFFVYVPKDEPSLKTLRFELPKDKALSLVKAKWGEPVVGEDLGKPVHYWFNPETEIAATLKDGYGDGSDLEFFKYSPAAKLLGEGKDIAFLSKAPVIGATVDELKAAYGQWLHVETAEEAKAQKAAIDKLTDGKSANITTAEPDAYLDLPPTEFGSQFMRVNLSWKEGKVTRYWFQISYRQAKAKKDEIFAMLEKKWGKMKEEKDLGDTIYVASEKPFIVVKPNTISDQWDIEVQPKR